MTMTEAPPITVADMRSRLLTVDTLRERLEKTEPIGEESIADGIRFELNEGLIGTEAGSVLIRHEGSEAPTQLALSYEGLTEAAAICGIPRAYLGRTPLELIQPHLNYWFSGDKQKVSKVLRMQDRVIAFTKATLQPYSNLRLLDRTLEAIEDHYGVDEKDVLVDYKMHHDLRRTHFRLIVPEVVRQMHSARNTPEAPDNWSAGIQVANSLVGDEPTRLNGYLFAWWCTNGATSQSAASGNYSRRAKGDPEEVYDWARLAVDEIIGGLEHEFEAIDALNEVELNGDTALTLRSVFDTYRVPANARERIIDNMANSDDLTAYGLHAAITAAANLSVDARAVDQLLRIGGILPHAMNHRCGECRRIKP